MIRTREHSVLGNEKISHVFGGLTRSTIVDLQVVRRLPVMKAFAIFAIAVKTPKPPKKGTNDCWSSKKEKKKVHGH